MNRVQIRPNRVQMRPSRMEMVPCSMPCKMVSSPRRVVVVRVVVTLTATGGRRVAVGRVGRARGWGGRVEGVAMPTSSDAKKKADCRPALF